MSKNYMVHVFLNGRVVFYDDNDVKAAVKNNQEFAIVCLGWAGGYTYIQGADKVPNYYVGENDPEFGKECYDMYGYEIKDEELTTEKLGKFYKMIFSQGTRIYMNTGGQATAYQGGRFVDYDSNNTNIFTEEDRKVINVQLTVIYLRSDSSDAEDYKAKVQALINCGILPDDAHKYADYKNW